MDKVNKIIKNEYVICVVLVVGILVLTYLTGLIIYDRNILSLMKDDITLQYVHLFNYVRNEIISGDFSFYSLSMGLGSNMVPSYAYYCMSPFNIIFLLSNEKTIPVFFSILACLKIVASSVTMKIYLKSKINNSLKSTLFSLFYSFSAFSLIYVSHIMWLDAVIMLPLITMGIEKIIEIGKCKLYMVSLSLSILFNFYISFAICIFSVVYFISYSLFYKKNRIMKFIFSSFYCGIINAWFLIPTIFGLIDSKMAVSVIEGKRILNYNILHILPRIFIGNISYADPIGLPQFLNIYCGILPILLFIILLFHKNIDKKLKRMYTSLIIIILVISNIDYLDKAMHLFAEPDYYLYRYLFIFSFLIIAFSYIGSEWIEVSKKNIIFSLILISLLSIIFLLKQTNLNLTLYLINLFFIISYLILISRKCKNINSSFVILIVLEMTINSSILFNNRIIENEKNYIVTDYKEVIDSISDEIYRIDYNKKEKNFIDGFNDSLSYGSKSTSMFFPTIDSDNYEILINILGYEESGMVPPMIANGTQNEVNNFLLGVKYLIEEDKTYIQNDNVLPIVFKTNNINNVNFVDSNLENQNLIYKELFKENLFETKMCSEIKYCECLRKNIECEKPSEKKYYIEIDEGMGLVRYALEDAIHGYVGDFRVYILETPKLQVKANNGLKIKFENDSIININGNNKNENQIIFTTIPYDDGWQVSINGKKIETMKAFNSLLAFEIPTGNLEIRIKFIPKGIIIGMIISIFTLIMGVIGIVKEKC